MKLYSIYKATCKVNNKVYIGYTNNFKKKQERHKTMCLSGKLKTKFAYALRKYGWNSFEWEIIYQSKEKDHIENYMENYFISQFNSINEGYNMTPGGPGGDRSKFIDYKKFSKKISESLLGVPKSEKHKLDLRGKRSQVCQKDSLNNNARKIQTPFGIFGSISEGAKKTNIEYKKFWRMLNSGNPDWKYIKGNS